MNRLLAILLLANLAACTSVTIPAQPPTGIVSPSPSPAIRSPTLPFAPSATVTPFGTLPSTETETPTPTYTLSPTPGGTSGLLLEISGCDTSLDISHGMGEVTNAYPLIQNTTPTDLTTVCATLSASDEDREHPDKTVCVDLLPAGYQVTLKLTVDTGYQEDTSIHIEVTSQEGLTASEDALSCRDLGFPGWVPGEVGVIKPIP
ncbi:MAG: hypothetical protein AB1531_03110 [Chloroflexota bacterium]